MLVFFSCCSVKLSSIVRYINTHKKLPKRVDSSSQFSMYKTNKTVDITYDYFEHYNNVPGILLHPKIYVDYDHKDQFRDYSTLQYTKIIPVVKRYFSPSKRVIANQQYLQNKYDIEVGQYIGLYVRDTDKYKETKLCSYQDYEKQIRKILTVDKNLKILLVTDSRQCLDYFNSKFKSLTIIVENKSSYSTAGIHNENSSLANYNDMFNLFSTFLIIAKCKYIICGSSNCSIWIIFYRGSCHNVCQYLNGIWLGRRIENAKTPV